MIKAEDINELYVINSLAETLDRVDLITGNVDHDVAVLGLYPNRLYANDTMVVVVNSGDANLQLIRLADYATIGYLHFPENSSPWDAALVGDTAAYVSLFGSHEVAYCNLLSRTVEATIAVGHHPEGILVEQDRIYVVNTAFDGLEFAYKQGTLYVIDRATFSVFDSVYTSRNPQALIAAPDGTIHIVCTGNYVDEFGVVDVFDPTSNTMVSQIDIGGAPGIIYQDRADTVYLADWGWGQGYLYKYHVLTHTVFNDNANPITPGGGGECAFVLGDMSNNLYVCEFNLDQISEFDPNTSPTGRSFAVGDGPAAMTLRTNRLPGDIDEDGMVNPVDVTYLVNRIYKNYPLPGLRESVGDVNHDCHINPIDIVYMVNYVYRNYGRLLWGCLP